MKCPKTCNLEKQIDSRDLVRYEAALLAARDEAAASGGNLKNLVDVRDEVASSMNLKNLVDAGKEAAAVVDVLDEVASRKMLRTEAALVAVRDEAASNTNLKNLVAVGALFSVPGCDRKPGLARSIHQLPSLSVPPLAQHHLPTSDQQI
ncbi:hypothetical protein V6N13_028003 [Hibiscus sabdariffa]|uniref:Uncharacterized protein n=1 Tax=Hibiscus sabdariffa TaxID=183260 RepID=A0ABR2CGN9_9ROSI